MWYTPPLRTNVLLRSSSGIANTLEGLSIVRELSSRFGKEHIRSLKLPRVRPNCNGRSRKLTSTQDQITNRHLGYAVVDVPREFAEELHGSRLEIVTTGLPSSEGNELEEPTVSEHLQYKTRLSDIQESSETRRPGRTLVLTAEIMKSQRTQTTALS